MEGEGCPPPCKQAKLFRYGFQSDGTAETSTQDAARQTTAQLPRPIDSQSNVAPASNSNAPVVTAARDQEPAGELDLPDRRNSRSPLPADGDGTSGSCAESSTESVHELGKQLKIMILILMPF